MTDLTPPDPLLAAARARVDFLFAAAGDAPHDEARDALLSCANRARAAWLHLVAAAAHAVAADDLDAFCDDDFAGDAAADDLLAVAFDSMAVAIAASYAVGFDDVDEADCENSRNHRSLEARHRAAAAG